MFSGFSTAANTFASAPMGRFSSTTLCAAAEKYADGGLKGEIVLIIAGAKPEEKEQMAVEQAVEEAKKFIASGDSASEAAKKAAKLSGHKKGDIYKLLQGEKDNG